MFRKNHKRRSTAVLAALPISAMMLAACGGGGDTGSGSEEGGGDVTLSFANSYPLSHAHNECGTQVVADKMAEQDLGVEIEVFPSSQLGPDTERFASVMSGDIDLDIQGSSALAATYAPIGVLDMAYAFDGPDHLFEWFDSDASTDLKENFQEETGSRILDVWYFGMREFTANQPIREPADLDGLRMRFPDSPTYLANAEAMGANATTVAFEEVYLALQQGIVDGQENPVPTIKEQSFAEVQSHVSLTGHQTGSQLIVMSDSAWQSLSADQQEALDTAVHEARAENRQCIEEQTTTILDEWKDSGEMTVVEDVDREAFSSKVEEYFMNNLEGEQLELFESIRSSAP